MLSRAGSSRPPDSSQRSGSSEPPLTGTTGSALSSPSSFSSRELTRPAETLTAWPCAAVIRTVPGPFSATTVMSRSRTRDSVQVPGWMETTAPSAAARTAAPMVR
ncbi:hypothetical protein [Streptomyces sp. NPDC020996]|uniref:hypothetical protein n=1 Tax=Streptomyces sp. NPDC020996 TaxID=3154791 RepID=UPI0033DE4465